MPYPPIDGDVEAVPVVARTVDTRGQLVEPRGSEVGEVGRRVGEGRGVRVVHVAVLVVSRDGVDILIRDRSTGRARQGTPRGVIACLVVRKRWLGSLRRTVFVLGVS